MYLQNSAHSCNVHTAGLPHSTNNQTRSLRASKDIRVTENFSIPLFVQAIVAPVYDRTYLVAGFSVGF